jgi:hypothetical protein
MAPAIHRKVAHNLTRTIGFGRNDSRSAAGIEFLAQPVIAEALVGDEGANLDPVEQGFSPDAVMTLTRQEEEVRQVAERINQGNDFRCQAASARRRARLSATRF